MRRMVYVIIALVVLSPLLTLAVLSAMATRPKNLGVADGGLGECPNTPNCVSSQATDGQHRAEPIAFDGTADDAMKQLKAVVSGIPRMKIISQTEKYLHAEATSLIFRFTDDVEFFIDRGARVIHFRSASRVGYSDLGANRARVESIRKAFKQQ